MKNKKGFTLIELLAIIVILAIIAVITVPIILGIIEDASKGAASDSAYGFKDSVNKYYVSELVKDSNFKLNDGIYTVSEVNGNAVLTGEETYTISLSGTVPTGGSVIIENNDVVGGNIQIGNYCINLSDMTVTKGECESQEPYITNLYYTYDENSEDGMSEKVSQRNSNWTYYIKETIEKNVIAENDIYVLYDVRFGGQRELGKQLYTLEACREAKHTLNGKVTLYECNIKYTQGSKYDKLLYSEVCGIEKGQEFCLSGAIGEISELINQGIFTNEECDLTTSSNTCTGQNVSILSSDETGLAEITGIDGHRCGIGMYDGCDGGIILQ